MKFEVFDRDGRIVFHTEYKECIPSTNDLKYLEETGHKLKVDGKSVKASKFDVSSIKDDKKSAPKTKNKRNQLF